MIIITQPNATEDQIERVVARVREFGLDAQISRGASRVIIGVIGTEDRIREKSLAAMPGVEAIVPLHKPYKLASFELSRRRVSRCDLWNGEDWRRRKHRFDLRALRRGKPGTDSLDRAHGQGNWERTSCAAALSSRGLRPTAFRVCVKTAFVSWRKRGSETGLPVITEIMDARDLAMVGSTPIASRSARATCKIFRS